MTLADRIAVFMDGRIVQVGTPREIFSTPRTMAVAGFIGTPPMNFVAGTWHGNAVTVAGRPLAVDASSDAPRDVMLGVRPNDLRIAPEGFAARVERVEDLGDSCIVSLTSGGRTLKLKSDRLQTVAEGEEVRLGFAPGAVHLFDPQTGARL